MFNFTPLLGAQSTSGAIQSLLELDGGVKILVDVGWDDGFSPDQLKQLEQHVSSISLILLTHATKEHLGAFAHCSKHIPLFSRIPVYATHPVISLGRTLIQALYSSSVLAASIIPPAEFDDDDSTPTKDRPNILLEPPTTDEIGSYFSHIHPLKYSQPHPPAAAPGSPPLNGLTITAYSAGHSLGGTIWHLQHGLESIVYAVDWNQAREHVASGAAWLDGPGGRGSEVIEHLRRPTALICSSRGSGRIAMAGGRKRRDEVLVSQIRQTLRRGGTVLIPCDSSARMLELAFVLENAAKVDAGLADGSVDVPLHRHRLAVVGATCSSAIAYAKSMLEWMDESMVREFEAASAAKDAQEKQQQQQQQQQQRRPDKGQNQKKDQRVIAAPFDFQFVKMVERRSRLNRLLSRPGPQVVLVSDSSLEWGFSRDVLARLGSDRRNAVILTDRSAHPDGRVSVGRRLWELYNERSSKDDDGTAAFEMVDLVDCEIATQTVEVEPLSADEAGLYERVMAKRKHAINSVETAKGVASLEVAAEGVDEAGSSSDESSDDESDTEYQGKALHASTARHHQTRHGKLVVGGGGGSGGVGDGGVVVGVNGLLKGSGRYDLDVRGRRGREKMFPFVSRRRRMDEYGEVIRAEDYLRAEEKEDPVVAGAATAAAAMPNGRAGVKRKRDGDGDGFNSKRHKLNGVDGYGSGDDDSDDDDGDDANDDIDSAKFRGPRKAIVSTTVLSLSLSLGFVDFSGRHDKRSLYMLIPLIRPQKLILTGGEASETADLAADCIKLSSIHAVDRRRDRTTTTTARTGVLTPRNGEAVDGSVETNAWTVKLSDGMVRSLQWQRVRGVGVVALTGSLMRSLVLGDERKEESTAAAEQPLPLLDLFQPGRLTSTAITATSTTTTTTVSTATTTAPLHVGDLRLAELRRLMLSSGYAAEFKGEGVLLINGCVVVRKTGVGRVEIENVVCGPGAGGIGSFFDIRSKIYDQLAVVDGA